MSIYLDSNATTRLDPRVIQAILEELEAPPSNPSSAHTFGQAARQRLSRAREQIATHFGFRPQEVIFTSGGTESLNTLIQGCRGTHFLSSAIEHAAVYEPLLERGKQGADVTFLKPTASGNILLEEVERAIRPDTAALIFSAANSETGVKTDLTALSKIAQTHQLPLLVDGVALLGKESFTIPQGVSAIAFSGHKLHAPKGTGLLLLRSSCKLSPLILGGGQEFGKRSGTENLPGIVGLAKATSLLEEELPAAHLRMKALRDRFERTLMAKLEQVHVNGGEEERLVNTSNLSFLGVDGESLLIQLDRAGIAASHGSACSSGALEPSRVLTQMALSPARVRSAVRFSLSRYTSEEEIDRAVQILCELIPRLRAPFI